MFTKILKRAKRFLAEDDGPTSIEYMVMISLIMIVCMVAINAIGQVTETSLSNTSSSISSATN